MRVRMLSHCVQTACSRMQLFGQSSALTAFRARVIHAVIMYMCTPHSRAYMRQCLTTSFAHACDFTPQSTQFPLQAPVQKNIRMSKKTPPPQCGKHVRQQVRTTALLSYVEFCSNLPEDCNVMS